MKIFVAGRSRGLAAWALAAALTLGPPAARAAEKAPCAVCAVTEGARTPEQVRAWRTHAGVRYALCSDKCARAFDAEPAAYVSPTFPRPAPELGMTDLAGETLDWERLRGHVVLVDFWATWCAPCRKSMPELQALQELHADRGFRVIGLAIDEPQAARKVRDFIAAKKIAYPIGLDTGGNPAWRRFGVRAVPAAFLVDSEGQIVAQWTGAPVALKELEKKLSGLLPPPAPARP